MEQRGSIKYRWINIKSGIFMKKIIFGNIAVWLNHRIDPINYIFMALKFQKPKVTLRWWKSSVQVKDYS